jgi:hypothetical protein
MRLTRFRLLLSTVVLLTLAACHPRDGAALASGGESPEAAVRQAIAQVRAGDFGGFWQHALPPRDYAMLRADWRRLPAAQLPLSERERRRFDAALALLAAPDAASALDARLQPWLAQTQARYGDQLPLLVAIGRALAIGTIAGAPDVSDARKHEATALVQALGSWAQQAPWFDPERARQAITVAVATARELRLRDAESLRRMDFDEAMRSYATAFAGIRQLLQLYGLPLDEVLASARVVPLDYHPPYARVRVEFQLMGTTLSAESTLVQQDGRWYDQDLLQSVRQAHRQLALPPAAASAAPVTVAAAR